MSKLSSSTADLGVGEAPSLDELVQNVKSLTVTSANAEAATEIEEDREFFRIKNEGNALFRKQKYEEALKKYDEASNHTKDEEELTALLYNKGATFEEMIEFEKALELYNEAIKRRPAYLKALKRRANLFSTMERHKEAMDDMLEISCLCVKKKQHPESFYTTLFKEVLSGYLTDETKKIVAERGEINPPKYMIEGYLRPFYADPVSKIWRGKSIVDDLIAEGKADDLTGYLAAVRDLKLRKYETIIKHCTDEIKKPSSEENLLNASYLRGTFGLIWGNSPETVTDFIKAIHHPLATNQLKSSAYLKLALRFTIKNDSELTELAEAFTKAEEMDEKNPDVYFHGGVALIDRGAVESALEMVEKGIKICGENATILMQALFWSVKFSVTNDEFERNEAFARLVELEPRFDNPDCHELFAQALIMCGQNRADQADEQMDKAVAFNPDDPSFKIKKLVNRHWGSDDMTECLDQLYKLVETGEANSLMYYQIGQFEMTSGNIEKGFAALEKSIEFSTSFHEIEARVGSKLEMQFLLKLNEKLKAEGFESLAKELSSTSLKSFP